MISAKLLCLSCLFVPQFPALENKDEHSASPGVMQIQRACLVSAKHSVCTARAFYFLDIAALASEALLTLEGMLCQGGPVPRDSNNSRERAHQWTQSSGSQPPPLAWCPLTLDCCPPALIPQGVPDSQGGPYAPEP